MTMRAALCGVLAVLAPIPAQAVMYRSNFAGEFGVVNPATAAFNALGTPGAGDPVSGICLDADGRMWGSLRETTSVTELIEINLGTGAVVNNLGDIELNGADLRITDLACQPGTGVIFGLDNSNPARLLTIDKTTADATLVGTTEVQRGGLAFAADGRLFAISVNGEFAQLDPSNAATIGQVAVIPDTCFDGFAIRPSDNLGFVIECDDDDLLSLNLATIDFDFIGSMGDFGADLEFGLDRSAAPTMSSLALSLLALAMTAVAVTRLRRARS